LAVLTNKEAGRAWRPASGTTVASFSTT
jgi:hypothetical protein